MANQSCNVRVIDLRWHLVGVNSVFRNQFPLVERKVVWVRKSNSEKVNYKYKCKKELFIIKLIKQIKGRLLIDLAKFENYIGRLWLVRLSILLLLNYGTYSLLKYIIKGVKTKIMMRQTSSSLLIGMEYGL